MDAGRKTDLITGGSGFFGTNLAFYLLSKKRKVRIYDLIEPIPELLNKVEFIKGDINDYKTMNSVCENVDTVYHTVAKVPLSKAGERFRHVNVDGTFSICFVSIINKVRKFIHISSSAIYDLNEMPITEESKIKPLGDYGKSKLDGEELVKASTLNWTIIRPRTILGPYRAGVFQLLFERVYNNQRIPIIGSGQNLFQLISARDLSEACFLASKRNSASNTIINIGNEDYGTFQELVEDLIEHADSKSKLIHINPGLAKITLRILDKLNLSPLADWHYKTIDKPFYFDISKAKRLLKWKPKDSNKDMIIDSYNWWIKHRNLKTGTTHRTRPDKKLLKLFR